MSWLQWCIYHPEPVLKTRSRDVPSFTALGGLFKEVTPGQSCSQDIENNYQNLSDRLMNAGVATIMPSSFYSRDNRFCEDNDNDYVDYGSAAIF